MNDSLDLVTLIETLKDNGLEDSNPTIKVHDISNEEHHVIWSIEYSEEEDTLYLLIDSKED